MNSKLGRGWVLAGLLAFTAGTAGVAGAALAQGGQAMHVMHGHGGATDPAAMDAHFDKMIAQMLPDGTPEQKARLKAIARSVHADLGGVHVQFGQTHARAHNMLLQPTIDRAGLEALRVEQVRQVDVISKRVVQALEDAAEILTPEQRARLAAHHKAEGAAR
jgi:Spy/CpxP family protein refolding chaperone